MKRISSLFRPFSLPSISTAMCACFIALAATTYPANAQTTNAQTSDIQIPNFQTGDRSSQFACGFTNLDFAPASINDFGAIAGGTHDAMGQSHGVVLFRGHKYSIDFPGSSSGTQLYKINNRGQILLRANPPGTAQSWYVYQNGVFTPIVVPGVPQANIYSINDKGDLVGQDQTTAASFIVVDGVRQNLPLVDPNNPYSGGQATDINDREVTTGYASARPPTFETAFLYQDGIYTVLNAPAFQGETQAYGINNRNQVVGSVVAQDFSQAQGYIFHDGNFQLFSFPGDAITRARAINDEGIVVGSSSGSGLNAASHSFIYNPCNQ